MTQIISRLLLTSTTVAGLSFAAQTADAQAARPIRTGQSIVDSLTSRSPRFSGGGAFSTYRFTASLDKRYIITLQSSDFDALVWVAREVGGITEELARDDDSGGGTDARLRFRPPTAGNYIIVAQSFSEDAQGQFTVLVEEVDPPTQPPPVAIRIGESAHGSITNDSPVDDDKGNPFNHFSIRGNGERVRIVARSEDFDTFLVLLKSDGRGGWEEVATDDDGADGTNSRINHVLDGEYRIIVQPLAPDGRGSYTLSVDVYAPAPVVQRTIAIGQSINGEIADSDPESDDGQFFHEYVVDVTAGESLRITLRSPDFDSFLRWGQRAGAEFVEIASDDDGGGNLDSQLDVRVESAGRYVIRVAGLGSGSIGAYELVVVRR